jgi:hypothetical protein
MTLEIPAAPVQPQPIGMDSKTPAQLAAISIQIASHPETLDMPVRAGDQLVIYLYRPSLQVEDLLAHRDNFGLITLTLIRDPAWIFPKD